MSPAAILPPRELWLFRYQDGFLGPSGLFRASDVALAAFDEATAVKFAADLKAEFQVEVVPARVK